MNFTFWRLSARYWKVKVLFFTLLIYISLLLVALAGLSAEFEGGPKRLLFHPPRPEKRAALSQCPSIMEALSGRRPFPSHRQRFHAAEPDAAQTSPKGDVVHSQHA